MINFVIVEDNEKHLKNIKNIVVSYMMNNNLEYNIETYLDNGKDLKNFIHKNKNETIYLLDLELPTNDGIEIAEYIRYKVEDWKSPIIVCTAFVSLSHEIYKQRLHILDFVAKCDDISTLLEENLNICSKIFDIHKSYKFIYKNTEYRIDYNNINYIQREGRKTIIVTKDNKYFQNISIKNIIHLLPEHFVISSKGTIINKNNVNKIDWKDGCVYFNDGTKDYIVSKTHRKEILFNA